MANPDDETDNGAGRTLGGSSEPIPSNWARPSQRPRASNPRPSGGARIAGLDDLNSAPAMPPAHAPHPAHDDDDDDDDQTDPNQPQSFFAGGERSGISVQGPSRDGENSLVRDLLRKAAQRGPPPKKQAAHSGPSAFGGGGHTLGSDEVESSFVPDPNAPEEGEMETAYRTVTFWREGFSIDDGELRRYEVPENARLLEAINSGHVPTNILNVRHGQPVELRLQRRTEESYVAPARKPSAAFRGEGQRLGAPVPTFTGESSQTGQDMPGAFSPQASSAHSSSVPTSQPQAMRFEVDEALPTTSIRVRLADGSNLTARMNLTHTVGDIRNFINASRPAQQSFTINTTFPNRVLEDDSITIESAGLKNTVLVQRYV